MQGQLVCVNHILSPNACFILTPSLDCVSYTPERLEKIATEAAKEDSVVSLSYCIRLLYNVSELSKAGLTQVSSLLTLFDICQNKMNCK
jgi:aminopeptidase 2